VPMAMVGRSLPINIHCSDSGSVESPRKTAAPVRARKAALSPQRGWPAQQARYR